MKFNKKAVCLASITLTLGATMDLCSAAEQDSSAQAQPAISVSNSAVLMRAQQKVMLAQQVTQRFVAEARQQGLDDNWRLALMADLMRAPEEQFALVENAADLNHAIGAASRIAQNTSSAGPKSLGGSASDLTFVPINPCRILDTRQGTGTAFAAGDTKVYTFKNTNVGHGSCSVYGDYSGLALPAALAVNITVDETGLSGFPVGKFLAVFPDGGTLGSSFMNFGPGDILANAGIITINQSTGLFDVKSSGPAQVIIDVFGIFLAPLPTALECQYSPYGETSLAAGVSGNAFSGTCASGYQLTSGICTANLGTGVVNGSGPSNDGSGNIPANSIFECTMTATTAMTARATGVCCRVPGRN